MFRQFVGVELLEEETFLIDAWLVQNYNSSQLTLSDMQRLFLTEFRHHSLGGGNQKLALETLQKIKAALKSKGRELVSEFERF